MRLIVTIKVFEDALVSISRDGALISCFVKNALYDYDLIVGYSTPTAADRARRRGSPSGDAVGTD